MCECKSEKELKSVFFQHVVVCICNDICSVREEACPTAEASGGMVTHLSSVLFGFYSLRQKLAAGGMPLQLLSKQPNG